MKRLIEIDLPIRQISNHSRREKSIRHGHISTLHIWWARRPLAACRAVILATLLPAPAEKDCPKLFQEKATEIINNFAKTVDDKLDLLGLCSQENREFWKATAKKPLSFSVYSAVEYFRLQQALLLFIADFSNWDCSTAPLFLETARQLVSAAYPDNKPLVADPFAGGGSIPLEALRVGAEAFASDLNPVAVLLNKVVLEYIPKYGQKLADAVKKEGERIKIEAEKELAQFYPKDEDGSMPIAYLWARTIQCEGPGCGATVPLLRSLWLAKKDKRKFALEMIVENKNIRFAVIEKTPHQNGTVVRGNATCPCCGYTTPVNKVREQLKKRKGGADDAILLAVVTTRTNQQGRFYREATQRDYDIVKKAQNELKERIKNYKGDLSLVPDEPLPAQGTLGFRVQLYGMLEWGDLFTSRQLLSLTTLCRLVREGTQPSRLHETTKSQDNHNKNNYQKNAKTKIKKIKNTGDIEYEINTADATGGNGDKPLAIEGDNHLKQSSHNKPICQEYDPPNYQKNVKTKIKKIKAPADILDEKPTGTSTVRINSVNSPGSEELHLTNSSIIQENEIVNLSDDDFQNAVQTCLALAVDRQADKTASLCRWDNTSESSKGVFGRQALPMLWDFSEVNVFSGSTVCFELMLHGLIEFIEYNTINSSSGQSIQSSATHHPFSDGSVDLFFTDPPYYDAVPYADLSDFFLVWLQRSIPNFFYKEKLSPKEEECVVDEIKGHDKKYFEFTMQTAMSEGRRILSDDGRAVVVFAHKSTAGWEAQLSAMIDAGWVITASWSIDTEMGNRLRAMNSAALASSIHLVCRPRTIETSGEWREVQRILPQRIHAWLPRLAKEGIVGADAIFACIGPALEIFSQYPSVEKANGDIVSLNKYLEHVWAVISKEALSTIFQGTEANSLEEDARLTCIWLWTLFSPNAEVNQNTENANKIPDLENTDADDDGEDEKTESPKSAGAGFSLDFDAARKIAQGLGAHLETLDNLVQIKGSTARLFSVEERVKFLFHKTLEDVAQATQPINKQKSKKQISKELTPTFDIIGSLPPMPVNDVTPLAFSAGKTVLDRIHQCMLLFGAGRSDAIRRFLVDENHGKDSKFWTLAQTLSALYPVGSTEKRWIDGLLAKKKGLGL